MDSSGILKVTAKDKATGKTQNITITGAVGLSEDEVKHMQEEAEKHKAEDEKKAEGIKAKNNADALIATAEKALKDGGDKVPADVKEKVEGKIKDLKDVLEKGSKEEIENKTKDLSETLSQIGQSMYGQQGQPSEEKKEENKKDEGKKEEKDKAEEGQVVE
jgi:molecular chaperone DnaK